MKKLIYLNEIIKKKVISASTAAFIYFGAPIFVLILLYKKVYKNLK